MRGTLTNLSTLVLASAYPALVTGAAAVPGEVDTTGKDGGNPRDSPGSARLTADPILGMII